MGEEIIESNLIICAYVNFLGEIFFKESKECCNIHTHLDRNNRKFYKILSHNELPKEKKRKI